MTKTFTGKEEAACKETILQTKGNACVKERIKPWNSIAQDVVKAKIVNVFKKGLDDFPEG